MNQLSPRCTGRRLKRAAATGCSLHNADLGPHNNQVNTARAGRTTGVVDWKIGSLGVWRLVPRVFGVRRDVLRRGATVPGVVVRGDREGAGNQQLRGEKESGGGYLVEGGPIRVRVKNVWGSHEHDKARQAGW